MNKLKKVHDIIHIFEYELNRFQYREEFEYHKILSDVAENIIKEYLNEEYQDFSLTRIDTFVKNIVAIISLGTTRLTAYFNNYNTTSNISFEIPLGKFRVVNFLNEENKSFLLRKDNVHTYVNTFYNDFNTLYTYLKNQSC